MAEHFEELRRAVEDTHVLEQNGESAHVLEYLLTSRLLLDSTLNS